MSLAVARPRLMIEQADDVLSILSMRAVVFPALRRGGGGRLLLFYLLPPPSSTDGQLFIYTTGRRPLLRLFPESEPSGVPLFYFNLYTFPAARHATTNRYAKLTLTICLCERTLDSLQGAEEEEERVYSLFGGLRCCIVLH